MAKKPVSEDFNEQVVATKLSDLVTRLATSP